MTAPDPQGEVHARRLQRVLEHRLTGGDFAETCRRPTASSMPAGCAVYSSPDQGALVLAIVGECDDEEQPFCIDLLRRAFAMPTLPR